MKSQYTIKLKLPDAPGVYFFLGRNKKILYIGRATSLRSRVRSYFASDLAEKRGPWIATMREEARGVDYRKTDSVLEAILLEADLIKKFQPPYNTEEKDDKSFNCVVITKEDFPRVLVVRKKDIDFGKLKINNCKLKITFGSFPNAGQLKTALKIIRRIFPFRDTCAPPTTQRQIGYSDVLKNIRIQKPCFSRQIGLCPGVCTGEITKKEYAKTIRNIILFFRGRKSDILRNLKREMRGEAKALRFESADRIKKTIFALQHIQDVSLITSERLPTTNYKLPTSFRIEAYDIAHISGTDVVGSMVVVENGSPKKEDYRKFKIRGGFGNNDTASLREVIERRLHHSKWQLPNLIVADGGEAQKSVIEKILREKHLSVQVVAVTKNDRHRPERILGDENVIKVHKSAILLANSEAHRFAITFHRARRSKRWKTQQNRV